MNHHPGIPPFALVNAAAVKEVLNSSVDHVMKLIEHAYLLHGQGETVNPPSSFLRFTDSQAARIIALPAAVDGDVHAAGIKWISSFPGNRAGGLPRASAVLILNDRATGFPVACLESSLISATRTAASAVLTANRLASIRAWGSVGFVGTGLIAGYVQKYLMVVRWPQRATFVYDADDGRAARFAERLSRAGLRDVRLCASADEVVRQSDLVSFCTTASAPYLHDPQTFAHHPLVLHLSLRDIGPEVIVSSANVVDDREHCLRENTSTQLAAIQCGNSSFLEATIPEVITGKYQPATGKPVILSPFGLGVLDIALADFVLQECLARGTVQVAAGFFADAGAEALLPEEPHR